MTTFFAVINVLVLSFMAFVIWKKDDSSVRSFFWPALTLKLAAGICVGLVYTLYYDSGDTISYFQNGILLADLARDNILSYAKFLWSGNATTAIVAPLAELQPRALFMVKIVSIVNLISHDNYWISSLYLSFVCFLAAWMLVKEIITINATIRNVALVGFLFFPSVVFWSSGLLKESLAMASLFFLAYGVLRRWKRKPLSPWQWMLIPVALWLLWRLKYYYLAVFFPVGFAFLLTDLVLAGRPGVRSYVYLLIWSSAFIVPLLILSHVTPNFYPSRFLEVVHTSYKEFHAASSVDDLIFYESFQPTIVSVLEHAPKALFSGLFRKLPWEVSTFPQLLSSLENIILLLLSLAAVTGMPRLFRSGHKLLLFSLALYCISLCLFLSLSTPNFGTLSRYRIGFLPFFFLLIGIENPLLRWVTSKIQRYVDHLVP